VKPQSKEMTDHTGVDSGLSSWVGSFWTQDRITATVS